MAQYRLNAYDADVFIPEFKGVFQRMDQMGTDLRYAEQAYNVETPEGCLYASRSSPEFKILNTDEHGFNTYVSNNYGVIIMLPEETTFPPIPGSGSTGYDCGFKDAFIVFLLNATYRVKWLAYGGNIQELTLPSAIRGALPNSWVNYEYTPYGETSPKVCTMLAYNSQGLYRYSDSTFTKITGAPASGKFMFIESFAERLWGINGDTIYYSRPYDMSDWTQDNNDPAQGGGEIRIPSFDGDQLYALKRFGDSLIVFAKERCWKISGSDPSNFYVQEQFGNGCDNPNTIKVIRDRMYLVQGNYLSVYDGARIEKLFRLPDVRTKEAVTSYCAHSLDDHYYLTAWSSMYDFNLLENSMIVRDCPPVLMFCEGTKAALTYNDFSSYEPYRASYNGIAFFDADTDVWNNAVDNYKKSYLGRTPLRVCGSSKWMSPWITLGRTDIKKGGFEFYFTPEVIEEPVQLSITIQTEKKKKTKTYTVQPISAADLNAGKAFKMKRLHFGGSGRRFRIIIETADDNIYPWRLVGGIHIIAETDVD